MGRGRPALLQPESMRQLTQPLLPTTAQELLTAIA